MRTTLLPHIVFLIFLTASAFTPIDRKSFYKALASDEPQLVEQAIAELEKETGSSRNNAYIGTLTMKKAGFVKGIGAKLKTFKQGANLLDNAIRASSMNSEFRFLRLSVQENAPAILNYNNELDEDRDLIVKGFDKMDPALKTIVSSYAKDSKVLKTEDLK